MSGHCKPTTIMALADVAIAGRERHPFGGRTVAEGLPLPDSGWFAGAGCSVVDAGCRPRWGSGSVGRCQVRTAASMGAAAAAALISVAASASAAPELGSGAAASNAPSTPVASAAVGYPPVSTIPGTTCPATPANSWWHADITRLSRHPRSAQWLSNMGAATRRLHPDFGPAYGEQPVPYGIPITVVRGAPQVPVRFDYAAESDRIRYPLSRQTKIEGGWAAEGDRHAIVVDALTCRLYETWDTHLGANGWWAGSGASWLLRSNVLRPAGWTSADAAGLPILPGLLRFDEVARGRVDHAIRFTTNRTSRAYLWPARHQAGATTNPAYPPMGARFRLKASFPIAGYSPQARVLLTGMKKHGMVLADNGSQWYFQGTSDPRWAEELIDQLKRVPASAFEAVDTRRLMISANSAAVRLP